MSCEQLRILVGGFLGLLPGGGVTWDYIQYPLALLEMGHDVYYIEDTRLYPVYQLNSDCMSCNATIAHLAEIMDAFGFGDRWAYRDEITSQWFGLPETTVSELCRTADIFINISCSTVLRDEYRQIPVRILIDSDPMFTQIQYLSQTNFTPGQAGMREMLDGHTHHATFGENIGAIESRIPNCGFNWLPTRQPICLSRWSILERPELLETAFTTVMNWTAAIGIVFESETWGQKDIEFRRFASLPKLVPDLPLVLAIAQTTGAPFPKQEILAQGWQILDPCQCVADWQSYQNFIQRSRGEFSVAKETYVKAKTGWFSCRSACYLAAGRPVITQETGWSRYIPAGEGLFAFNTLDEAVTALTQVVTNPTHHAKLAREIAEEYFASERVLGKLLSQVGA